ncbi:MAG: protein kinase domain-containing protein, partial [Planctomycetota bacterium]
RTASAGTFVGEQKIQKAQLAPNSAFRVGDTVIGLRPAPRAPGGEGDPLVGKIVGGYHVREVVGRGGMGTVYKATQLSLHRDVALKVLAAELAKDVAFRNLFINEARAAGQLVHPNVVQVYDAGTEGDLSYFSMEFISQGSVEEILERRGKMPWQEAILMVLEAAHGLDYAEKKRIVHRDIKPDNLMINEDGRVKIADLGLAKRGGGAKGDEGIIGTPHFIPPEQALGREVDTRADIYSLGATFFRMITGRTLFAGKSAKEIVLKHVNEPPPAASSLDEEISSDVDLLLAKMLAKDPAQRYGNAQALIQALEETCAHHGIKGAIIKRGFGKRVLIPLVLVIVAAGGAIAYLATRPPEFLEDADAKEAARREAAKRREAEEQLREQTAMQERRSRAGSTLTQILQDRTKLNERTPLDEVYDVPALKAQREQEWRGIVDRYRAFAGTPEAKEFQLDADALKEAEGIEKRLKELEQTVEDRATQRKQKLEEVERIKKQLTERLNELLRERRYTTAYAFCDLVATGLPDKDDPFLPITSWEWVNKDNAADRWPWEKFTDLKNAVSSSRRSYLEKQRALPDQAAQDWASVKTEVSALVESGEDADLEKAIERLKEVADRFSDPAVKPLQEIELIRFNADTQRANLEKKLEADRETRQREDREMCRMRMRKIRTLRPDALDNPVMDVTYGDALVQLARLREDAKTPRYKAFVTERIAIVGWMDWLTARFRVDVHATLTTKGAPSPLRSLELEFRDPATGVVSQVKLDKPAQPRDEFAIAPGVRNQRVFKLGAFPMDWVYHSCFRHKGQPRWSDAEMNSPALRFALGAFCYETFQFKEAREHFNSLLGDATYGEVARHFAGLAGWEAEARAEYETLLKAADEAKTAAEAEASRKLLSSFPERHKGRLFVLEVLPPGQSLGDDFFDAGAPKIPEAPPPPKLPQ